LDAVNAVARDDGWSPLSRVGGYINKNTPAFDSRSYGYDKLGKLVKSLNYIEIKEQSFTDGTNNVHIYIKEKSA